MKQQESPQRKYLYSPEDIDWMKLADANIYVEDLDEAGQMETLLQTGTTGIMNFKLNLLGIGFEMSGRLHIREENGIQHYEVVGIGEEEVSKEV